MSDPVKGLRIGYNAIARKDKRSNSFFLPIPVPTLRFLPPIHASRCIDFHPTPLWRRRGCRQIGASPSYRSNFMAEGEEEGRELSRRYTPSTPVGPANKPVLTPFEPQKGKIIFLASWFESIVYESGRSNLGRILRRRVDRIDRFEST